MNEEIEHTFSLTDQDFLKQLGITAMSSGQEFALREQQKGLDALPSIEDRAGGLICIVLDEQHLELFNLLKKSASKMSDDIRMLRDLDSFDSEPE